MLVVFANPIRSLCYTSAGVITLALPDVSPGTSVMEGDIFIVNVELVPPLPPAVEGLTSTLFVNLFITDGTTSKAT